MFDKYISKKLYQLGIIPEEHIIYYEFILLPKFIGYTLLFLACIIIPILSPVDHMNKRIDIHGKNICKVLSLLFLSLIILLFFYLSLYNMTIYTNIIIICLSTILVDQIIGIILDKMATAKGAIE